MPGDLTHWSSWPPGETDHAGASYTAGCFAGPLTTQVSYTEYYLSQTLSGAILSAAALRGKKKGHAYMKGVAKVQ